MGGEITAAEVAAFLRAPSPDDDKYSRGVLGFRTGSERFPGAAVLGVDAAWRTGVGMVRYLGPEFPRSLVLQRRPETVTVPGRVQAWVIGSGTDPADRRPEERAGLAEILRGEQPVIVDAGSLDLAADATAPVILTPHARELARLRIVLGLDEDAPASTIADQFGAVIVAKGSTTQIVAPSGWRRVVTAPTNWLATAGTGDVLAGIIGAVVAGSAARLRPEELAARAAAGVWIHGHAAAVASARSNGGPIVALDVVDTVPGVVGTLVASSSSGGENNSSARA